VANGLMRETVELAHNYYIPAVISIPDPRPETISVSYIASTNGRASSAPIPIPKTGLKISVNPARWKAGTAFTFRVMCVSITDDGLILDETSPDLFAEATTQTSTAESVYIPYVEGAYIVIDTGDYGSDPARLVDAIYAYSGEVETYGGNGKLLGLHPVRVFRQNGVPQILFGSKSSIINTSRYYGGALWLRYTKSITVATPYDIVANVYRLEDDGTRTLVDSYYTMEQGTDNGKVAGVQHIDLSGYDFDGFIFFAVHNRVQYDASAGSALSYKKNRGMGVMGQYLDVYNSVFVEYRNAYQYTVETGLQPTVFDNANAFMQYKFPERLASYYVHEWETEENRHYFDETYDATPAFYAGSYDANEVFLNVEGRSYWTGMYNINSRCYQFVRDTEHTGTTNQGRIGYGLTCTDFVSVLLGLRENYPPSAMAFATPYKFDVVADDWDYQTQMDLLRPGDVLTEYRYGGSEGQDATTEHCMICYEKKYVNGQLECIVMVEAGYPYTRFTCLYNDKYVGLVGNFQSIRRLGDYHYIRRIKPQYLTSIRETFDLSKSYTPGTIMCDRGTNSVYCTNPHPTNGWALEQPELLLTITDDTASTVVIYKNGDEVASVSIGSQTRNGYRVLDIKDYILPYGDTSPEGLYTLKTNTSADVQERFWVQGPREFFVDGGDDDDRIIHVPDLANLRYMAVIYHKTVIDQEVSKTANQYLIVTPEEFGAATPEAGQPWDATWGEYTAPAEALDGATYHATKLIYGVENDGTDFGTYQLRFLDPYGAGVAVYASSEYQFGA